MASRRKRRMWPRAGQERTCGGQALGRHPPRDALAVQRGGAPLPSKVGKPLRPGRQGRQHEEGEQRVVQFLGIPHERPGLVAHLHDGTRVERAHLAGLVAERAPHLHGARPPFLERGIVEVREWVRVEDLVREGGRLGRLDGVRPDRPAQNARDHAAQSLEVHRLVQAVADRLVHQRVIRDPNLTREVLRARRLIRKDRGQQVVRAHALNRCRDLAAAGESKHRQRARTVPAPAGREHRRREHRLRQDPFHRRKRQEAEHGIQGKAVLLGQRDDDAIVGGGRLELEVEGPAEALAQGQAPGTVDPRAKRGVEHELHAPGLVEEAFRDDGGHGGDGAESRRAGAHVSGGLLGAGAVQPALAGEEVEGDFGALRPHDVLPHARHFSRKLGRAPWGLSPPERDGGRRAAGVLDAHLARLDAPDSPRRGSQQEDVAGHAFHGEIFVDTSHHPSLWLGDHEVVGVIGNRAAGCHGGQSGAAPPADDAVDAIPVEIRRGAAPTSGRHAFRQHRDDRVEFGPREISIREGASDERVEIVLAPRLCRRGGHDLLRENVARPRGYRQAVECAGADRAHERSALDQLVARRRKEAALRQARHIDVVARSADALKGHADRSRRANLADQVHGPDVDAQLQGRCCDDRAKPAVFQAVLGCKPHRPGQAAVVREHGIFAQSLLEAVGHAFRQAARVDEDERGPVGADEGRPAGRRSRPTSPCSRPRRVPRQALQRPGRSGAGDRYR